MPKVPAFRLQSSPPAPPILQSTGGKLWNQAGAGVGQAQTQRLHRTCRAEHPTDQKQHHHAIMDRWSTHILGGTSSVKE